MGHEKSQTTLEIMKLLREGVRSKDIAAQLNVNVQKVYDAKQDMKEAEKKAHMAAMAPTEIKKAPKAEADPVTVAFTSPTIPIVKASSPSSDLSSLHAMIDLAAKLPTLKADILKACEEMETTARYQLSLVATIKGTLGV